MKGFRFYEEFKDDARRERAQTVVAVHLDDRGQPLRSCTPGMVDAIAA